MCGAFLHERIAVLNLFSTAWMVIEAPRSAFLRIARSEQKNYTMLLFAAAGPVVCAAAIAGMYEHAGELPFPVVFALIGLAGPFTGVFFWLSITTLLNWISRLFAAGHLLRTTVPLGAYSLVPVVIASVFVLPTMLAVFGQTLFDLDPAPWETNPGTFWSLGSALMALFLWHLGLMLQTFRVLGNSLSGSVLGTMVYLGLLSVGGFGLSWLMLYAGTVLLNLIR